MVNTIRKKAKFSTNWGLSIPKKVHLRRSEKVFWNTVVPACVQLYVNMGEFPTFSSIGALYLLKIILNKNNTSTEASYKTRHRPNRQKLQFVCSNTYVFQTQIERRIHFYCSWCLKMITE